MASVSPSIIFPLFLYDIPVPDMLSKNYSKPIKKNVGAKYRSSGEPKKPTFLLWSQMRLRQSKEKKWFSQLELLQFLVLDVLRLQLIAKKNNSGQEILGRKPLKIDCFSSIMF